VIVAHDPVCSAGCPLAIRSNAKVNNLTAEAEFNIAEIAILKFLIDDADPVYYPRAVKLLVVISLIVTVSVSVTGQQPHFNVRYLGGTIASKDKSAWTNKLLILSDEIRLEPKDGKKISIDPKSVTSISYGREATRHVARWVALGILVTPIALMGLFNENVQHYISIEYKTSDGLNAGVLIQAHKDNYRNVLAFLKGATGKEIETETKNLKAVTKENE
jgi:hypothetical protein